MPHDRLKFTLEAAEVGLWDWDIASGDLWWSDNLAAIHGRDPAEFDGSFDRFLSFIHTEDRPGFLESLDHAIAHAADFEAEFRVQGKDDVERWVAGRGRVFRNEQGESVRAIGIGFDTSERRQRESAAQHLGTIVLASHDAIVAVDSEGKVTAWSPGAERLFGYQAPEMIGSPIARIVPQGRSAEIDHILRELSKGVPVENYETVRIRKDGSPVFVSISSGPLFDDQGKWIGAATITQDISARRHEAMRQRLLSDAGRVLSASTNALTMLTEMARLVTASIADRCQFYLQSDGDAMSLTAQSSADASSESEQREDLDFSGLISQAVATKQPLAIETVRTLSAKFDAGSSSPSAPATGLVVPLIARGEAVGAMVVMSLSAAWSLDSADIDVFVELGRRLAIAIDNAGLLERLQQTERQLRLIADNLPAMVSYVGSDLRYHFVNRRYEEYLGVSTDQLVGKHLRDVIGQPGFTRVEPELELALSGQPVRFDVDVEHSDVGLRRVEVNYVPDVGPDGETRGAVALILDITDRTREARRAKRLSELTAALACAVTESDVANRIAEHGVTALGGTRGIVVELNRTTGQCIALAHFGLDESLAADPTFSLQTEPHLGEVLHSNQPVFIDPRRDVAGPDASSSVLARCFASGCVVIPLLVNDSAIDTLIVDIGKSQSHDENEWDYIAIIGKLAAQSLDRAKAYDAERRARSATESDRARVTFLSDASRILAGSLDAGVGLKGVTAIATGSLCDWCTVQLFDADGGLRRLATVHCDPAMGDLVHELEEKYSVLPDWCWSSVRSALAQGISWFDPVVKLERLENESLDTRHRELLERLGFASEIVVPMVAGGRLVGAMAFVRGAGSASFTADDLSLAEELGSRIALALENNRLVDDIQSSEARYRTLFEEASEAIVVVDLSGVVRGGNDAASLLLGIERDRLVGRAVADFIVAPRDQGVEDVVLEFLQASWQGELEVVRHDGVAIPVELHTTLVELPAGPAFLVSLRDISERQALDRLQRDFLAMVTHDLRSPLSAIRVQSQLMRRRGVYSDASVDAIIQQTDRMARLINALADVVRMDSGRLELNRGTVDLVALAEQIVAQERANAPDRAIVVRASSPVHGYWDADRLSQVIANLIGNAVKYGPDESSVIVDVSSSGGDALISVIDSGPGIASEHVSKLFERFFRADVTGAGGLGLGLYIARMLTEAHGGQIVVDSEPGRGSTFTVVLPLSPGDGDVVESGRQ